MKVPTIHSALFISRSKIHFSSNQLETFFNSIKTNNQQNSITGYLYYNENYFFQYMESYNEERLNVLINNIKLDTRHTILQWLKQKDHRITRRFKSTTIRWVYNKDIDNIDIEESILKSIELTTISSDRKTNRELKAWKLIDTLAENIIFLKP